MIPFFFPIQNQDETNQNTVNINNPTDVQKLQLKISNSSGVQGSSTNTVPASNPPSGLPTTQARLHLTDHSKNSCFQVEKPNRQLYAFQGNVSILNNKSEEFPVQKIPLSTSHLLLRGSQLRNTKGVIGLVIYTGVNTKLMKNANAAPIKLSNVQKKTNTQIMCLFVVMLGIWLGWVFSVLLKQIFANDFLKFLHVLQHPPIDLTFPSSQHSFNNELNGTLIPLFPQQASNFSKFLPPLPPGRLQCSK